VLVNEEQATVLDILGQLQKAHSIRDMQLQEISTEEVIKKIYEEGVQ
jgi:ABC-2 type transport system ATP-binding protein